MAFIVLNSYWNDKGLIWIDHMGRLKFTYFQVGSKLNEAKKPRETTTALPPPK